MARMPDPWKSLRTELEKLRERIRRLENASPFSGTGLSIPADGTTQVTGNLLVTGDFTAEGKVSNDALTDPVIPQVARLSASAFSLTTTYADKDTASLTVPEGCTRLLASVQGRLYVVNTNTTGGADGTGTEAIYVRLTVGTNQSTATPTGVSGSNGFASTTGQDAFLLTGLAAGDPVTFAVGGKCGYSSIPTYADNYIIATATLIWLR